MPFTTTNPYTQEPIRTFAYHKPSEVETILLQAEKAYATWRATSTEHRQKILRQVAEELRCFKDKWANLISLEMGKPITEARAEVEKCAITCYYYAEQLPTLLASTPVLTEAYQTMVRYEPLGAILGIMPWNFPFWQVFRFAIPAIAGGNVVLLKHAPNVWGCAEALGAIWHKAGLPIDAFQTLFIEVDSIESIIAHPAVQAVTFTGSTEAGGKVAALAGKYCKKSVLELGGSDAFIVLADADIVRAAKVATHSRMLNAGQSCIAAKRFLVERQVYATFMELFKQNITALKVGNPALDQTQIGAMARPDLVRKAQAQLQNSMAMGAELWCGGNARGNVFEPTLLGNVSPTMPVFQEEVFAPIAAVMPIDTTEQGIAIANESAYGLGASVWTSNIAQAEYYAQQLAVGNVFVNAMVKSDARLPFGGIKKSGYGRELGHWGLHEFMDIQTLWVEK